VAQRAENGNGEGAPKGPLTLKTADSKFAGLLHFAGGTSSRKVRRRCGGGFPPGGPAYDGL